MEILDLFFYLSPYWFVSHNLNSLVARQSPHHVLYLVNLVANLIINWIKIQIGHKLFHASS